MASYQTKLKVGRKLEGVDTSTASDNQISALFRFDEDDGSEDHVSLSIESDAMDPEDVFAVFQLLHDRGVLTAGQSKTWLHQPKASREAFGDTATWQGMDLQQKVTMLSKGLTVKTGSSNGGDAKARNKQALLKLSEVEEELRGLKETLQGADAKEAGASSDADEQDTGPTPPNAL